MHRIGFDTKEYHPEYEQIMRDITMSVSVQNSETGETHNIKSPLYKNKTM